MLEELVTERTGGPGAAMGGSLRDRIVEPSAEERELVVSAIEALLATAGIPDIVNAYFDPDGPFAAATFDTLDPGPPNELTLSDLFAITFLDVQLKPPATRRVLDGDSGHIRSLLAAISCDVDLWDASDDELANVLAACDHLCGYDGTGEVTAGKLLARKRPRLVPIIDDVVRDVLRLPRGRAWTSLRAALEEEGLRKDIDELRPPSAPAGLTTIRVLDVAAWMSGSRSRKARKVRKQAGVPSLVATSTKSG